MRNSWTRNQGTEKCRVNRYLVERNPTLPFQRIYSKIRRRSYADPSITMMKRAIMNGEDLDNRRSNHLLSIRDTDLCVWHVFTLKISITFLIIELRAYLIIDRSNLRE